MALRQLLWVGATALVLASCGSGTSGNVVQNGQASAPPAAPSANQAPQLRVGLENGECRVAWNGRAVNGQQLLEAGVAELDARIERVQAYGLTAEMMAIGISGSVDTPWRCIGGVIAQVQRAGFARLALTLDGAPPAGLSLPVEIDTPVPTDLPPPPIEPETNRVTVANDGALRWNGAPVDAQTLRTYLAATQRTVPVPRLQVEIDGQASFAAALGLLDQLRRAGVPVGPGADLPPPEESLAPPGFDTPPSVVSEVPPPGDGFELIGLERFVPDLR